MSKMVHFIFNFDVNSKSGHQHYTVSVDKLLGNNL